MKRVSGFVNARPIGSFDFEFFVPEDTSDKEIEDMIKDKYELYISFDTEDGYEEATKKVYRKGNVEVDFC